MMATTIISSMRVKPCCKDLDMDRSFNFWNPGSQGAAIARVT
jgi:hypothetical protein